MQKGLGVGRGTQGAQWGRGTEKGARCRVPRRRQVQSRGQHAPLLNRRPRGQGGRERAEGVRLKEGPYGCVHHGEFSSQRGSAVAWWSPHPQRGAQG